MIYNVADFDVEMFHNDCSQFEYYRNIALGDPSNKNAADFTRKKLVIENHIGYYVMHFKPTNEPAVMGGLIEVVPGVGRMLNRHYIFPNFRNKSFKQLVSALQVVMELGVKPLYQISPFDVHVLTMPNRTDERNQGFWRAFVKSQQLAWPGHWHEVDGYIQTGKDVMSKRSWQNALTDDPNWKFQTINHDQWLLLR